MWKMGNGNGITLHQTNEFDNGKYGTTITAGRGRREKKGLEVLF